MSIQVTTYTRENSIQDLKFIKITDYIVHLAGVNRSDNEGDFKIVNHDLTLLICDEIRSEKKNIPIILASTIHTKCNNLYGKTKLSAEMAVKELEHDTGNYSHIYRLQNVWKMV